MTRPVYYCKSWFRAKNKPIEIWAEPRAKSAHFEKQTYTVLVDSIERPYCFIEVSSDAVSVGFLDNFLRESLVYSFQEVEAGKLFLTMAIYREFEDATEKIVCGSSYYFTQDGTAKITSEYFNPHRIESSESFVDVSFNYSFFPRFGNYGDLIRIERHKG